MNTIALDISDLAFAASLVIVDAAISMVLRLRLERRLLISAVRMVVQLSLVGLLLKTLFEHATGLWVVVAGLLMVLIAGREIMARQDRRLRGLWAYGLGTTSMMAAGTLVTTFALVTQIRPDPWYDPRYVLPLLGMILGNTMTGISLGLNHMTTSLVRDRAAVEAQLALGATRTDATLPAVRTAMRTALTPIINSMAVAGVVSMPGMMTGQILAGADPGQAVRYQILIIFLIAGGTALGATTAVLIAARRLTDDRHRLRLDRLR